MWRDTSFDKPLPDDQRPDRLYHVSPSLNRQSIQQHGLDWRRISTAPGIPAGPFAEEPVTYLAQSLDEALWFGRLRNHDEPVHVWEVRATGLELVLTGDGWIMTKHAVPRKRLTLVRADVTAR